MRHSGGPRKLTSSQGSLRDVVRRSRRSVGVAYERAASPFGRRAVTRMLADGLPPELATPIRSLFGAQPSQPARGVVEVVEDARRSVELSGARYRFHAPASDGVRWLVRDDAGEMTSRSLAQSVSVPPRWGLFLHLCAESFRPAVVLEIGTCIGVSGAYLAAVSSRPLLVTLDGSSDLASVATRTLDAVSARRQIVVGRFDETLESALHDLSVDLAYVDGHHDGAATRGYVRRIAPTLTPRSLIVLDDIRLNGGMWQTWLELAQMPGVTTAVDVGRFGLLVWDGGDAIAETFDLARYVGLTRRPKLSTRPG